MGPEPLAPLIHLDPGLVPEGPSASPPRRPRPGCDNVTNPRAISYKVSLYTRVCENFSIFGVRFCHFVTRTGIRIAAVSSPDAVAQRH